MEILSPAVSLERISAPFPHWVLEDFLTPAALRSVNAQWPTQWDKESGKNQLKWNTQAIPSTARAIVETVTAKMVSELTGIAGLIADPELFGAGLHCIPPGGFLRMHVDFNAHPKGWTRRINFLLYLNERWEDEWGGALQLGVGKDSASYMPRGGRAVVFETNGTSWHGHPLPLTCPQDVQRRSLALYFYVPEPPKEKVRTTVYRK